MVAVAVAVVATATDAVAAAVCDLVLMAAAACWASLWLMLGDRELEEAMEISVMSSGDSHAIVAVVVALMVMPVLQRVLAATLGQG